MHCVYSVQPAILRYKVYEPLLVLGLDKFSQGTYPPDHISASPTSNTGSRSREEDFTLRGLRTNPRLTITS